MRTDLGHLQYGLIEPFIGRMIRSSSISHDDDGWVGSFVFFGRKRCDERRDGKREKEKKTKTENKDTNVVEVNFLLLLL